MSPEAPAPRRFRVEPLLYGLFAACVARLWLMAMPSGLWVDELVTVFMIRHPNDPSLAVAPQLAESIYYWLPKISTRLLGTSEIVLRLPSVLMICVALFFVARLSARLIHRDAQWFTVAACFLFTWFNYFAVDARPYALGMAVASASLFYLVRWFDKGGWVDELIFIVLAALLWRTHLLYWPFYVVYAVYGVSRLFARDGRAGALRILVAVAAVGASLIPVAQTALRIGKGAAAHAFMPVPGKTALFDSSEAMTVLGCALVFVALKFLFKWKREEEAMPLSSWGLFVTWWLVCPLGLFAYSRISHNGVLIPRYVSLMLPGAALTTTAIVARFLPARHWKRGAALVAVAALLMGAEWTRIWPSHGFEGWREGARFESEVAGETTPVICPSPYIEALPPVWKPDYHLPGFLYAHLGFYPMRGKAFLLPYEGGPEANRYLDQILNSDLVPSGKFIVYGPPGQAQYLYQWLESRGELATWFSEAYHFDSTFVVVYSIKRTSPTPQ